MITTPRNTMRWAIAILLASCSLVPAADDTPVPYPKNYRSWTFLHASVISPTLAGFWQRPCEKPCTAGIFYFYANAPAMDGIRTGKFEDGAIFAEELLELQGKPSGAAKEGPRHLVGVMVKDNNRYRSTGGWGFGSFDGVTLQDQLDNSARQTCFACHIPRKDHGYVFTEYLDR